jgi:hypothetical protein
LQAAQKDLRAKAREKSASGGVNRLSRTDPAKNGQTCSDALMVKILLQFIAIDAQTFLTKMSHLLCIRIVCTGIEFRVSTAW